MTKLAFHTTGKYFTDLLLDLVSSGEFYNAIKALDPLPNDIKFKILRNELIFEDDTNINPDLDVVENTKPDYTHLYYGLRTLAKSRHLKIHEIHRFESYGIDLKSKSYLHYRTLKGVKPIDEIIELYALDIIEDCGYRIHSIPSLEFVRNGVFLRNGNFVECPPMGHRNLYDVLSAVGLSDSNEPHRKSKLINISERCAYGSTAYALSNLNTNHTDNSYDLNLINLSNHEIDSLFAWREHFNKFNGYNGETKSIIDALRTYLVLTEQHGGKYGNLQFLKRFYSNEINTPKISKTPLEGKYCIRTSPNRSLPGLLNSKFDVTENSEKEIFADWEKYKDVLKENELHIFYQEYLEGVNGVCHYRGKGYFEYQASNNRGDVVNGSKTSIGVSNEIYDKLREISRNLFNDLNSPIQLEFVITEDNTLYIVQLRTLETPDIERVDVDLNDYKDKIIGLGKTFSTGLNWDFSGANNILSKEDVLIVDNDCDSEELIGKKALIVTNNVEFSHILAFSQVKKIPSLYGLNISSDDLPDKFRLLTEYQTALILKN